MAKNLTNKQLQIVVDEIFNKISQPIIDSNKVLIEEVEIPTDEYQEDFKESQKLSKKIKALSHKRDLLKQKWKNTNMNGVELGYWCMDDGHLTDYINERKSNKANFKEYLSKNAIEKQVILAGNKDIPALIEELILKLSK